MPTVNESASRDAAANTGTTYTMAVGDTFNGNLGEKFDEDWIEIRLERGETYKINLSGRGSKGDEAEDTILKLYDSGGNLRCRERRYQYRGQDLRFGTGVYRDPHRHLLPQRQQLLRQPQQGQLRRLFADGGPR